MEIKPYYEFMCENRKCYARSFPLEFISSTVKITTEEKNKPYYEFFYSRNQNRIKYKFVQLGNYLFVVLLLA